MLLTIVSEVVSMPHVIEVAGPEANKCSYSTSNLILPIYYRQGSGTIEGWDIINKIKTL